MKEIIFGIILGLFVVGIICAMIGAKEVSENDETFLK